VKRHQTPCPSCPADGSPSWLCITPPRRRIALSRLNHRQRCEQHLAVFFDNLAPWPALTALDISTALSHLSCGTLQLLVESLPQLHHLSLPPVATCTGTEAEVLCMLQQLPCLCACDLDCSFFRLSSSSSLQDSLLVQYQELQDLSQPQQPPFQLHHLACGQMPAMSASAPLFQLQDGQHQLGPALLPVQQQVAPQPQDTSSLASEASQPHKLLSIQTSSACTAGCSSPKISAAVSTCSGSSSHCTGRNGRSAFSGPWSGLAGLPHVQHLQLQHLCPESVCVVLRAVGQMQALHSFSVTGLCRTAAGFVLAPLASARAATEAEAAATDDTERGAKWLLSRLVELPELTRLEIG
jgi:hypothetical protein